MSELEVLENSPKLVKSHSRLTDSLDITAFSDNQKRADMSGILKRPNKNGTYSYRAQVRLKDGMLPQSKCFPTLASKKGSSRSKSMDNRIGTFLGNP